MRESGFLRYLLVLALLLALAWVARPSDSHGGSGKPDRDSADTTSAWVAKHRADRSDQAQRRAESTRKLTSDRPEEDDVHEEALGRMMAAIQHCGQRRVSRRDILQLDPIGDAVGQAWLDCAREAAADMLTVTTAGELSDDDLLVAFKLFEDDLGSLVSATEPMLARSVMLAALRMYVPDAATVQAALEFILDVAEDDAALELCASLPDRTDSSAPDAYDVCRRISSVSWEYADDGWVDLLTQGMWNAETPYGVQTPYEVLWRLATERRSVRAQAALHRYAHAAEANYLATGYSDTSWQSYRIAIGIVVSFDQPEEALRRIQPLLVDEQAHVRDHASVFLEQLTARCLARREDGLLESLASEACGMPSEVLDRIVSAIRTDTADWRGVLRGLQPFLSGPGLVRVEEELAGH